MSIDVRLSKVGLVAVPGPFPVAYSLEGFKSADAIILRDTLPEVRPDWHKSDSSSHDFGTRSLRPGTVQFDEWLARDDRWRGIVTAFLSAEWRFDAALLTYSAAKQMERRSIISSPILANVLKRTRTADEFASLMTEITYGSFYVNALGSGDLNTPHSDGNAKFLTLLIYFPGDDWDAEIHGGQTLFYDVGSVEKTVRWIKGTGNSRIHPSEVAEFESSNPIFHRSLCVDNEWCIFCKSLNSFHAVRPVTCSQGRWRRALVINMRYRGSASRSPATVVKPRASSSSRNGRRPAS